MIKNLIGLKTPNVSEIIPEDIGSENKNKSEDDDNEEARNAHRNELAMRHRRNQEEREKVRDEIRKKYGLKNTNIQKDNNTTLVENMEDGTESTLNNKSCCLIS